MKLTIRTFIALIILSLCCLSNTQDRKSGRLFVVIVDDKRGYIDQNGRTVINPQFEGASDFSEGLAVISTSKNGYSVLSARQICRSRHWRVWWPTDFQIHQN